VAATAWVTVSLTVQTVDVSVTKHVALYYTAQAMGASYQWLDCNNGMAVIPGATAQSYTASANGNYSVQVTQSNCTDTSESEA
jgi:PKD repeat protein